MYRTDHFFVLGERDFFPDFIQRDGDTWLLLADVYNKQLCPPIRLHGVLDYTKVARMLRESDPVRYGKLHLIKQTRNRWESSA